MSEAAILEQVNLEVQNKLGLRVVVTRLDRSNQKYVLHLGYNQNFFFHEGDKTHVRNIHLRDIFYEEFTTINNLELPYYEINHAIQTRWAELSANIFSQTIRNQKIVLSLLSITYPLSFINPFYDIHTRLLLEDGLSATTVESLLRKKNGSKYLEIIEKHGFIEKKGKGYVATNKFKSFVHENNKLTNQRIILESIALIISKEFQTIKDQLKLGHIEAFLKVISTFLYIKNNFGRSVNDKEAYAVFDTVFGGANFEEFKNKLYRLHVDSDLLLFSNNEIKINPAYLN